MGSGHGGVRDRFQSIALETLAIVWVRSDSGTDEGIIEGREK